MTKDLFSDMLIRLKNASLAKQAFAFITYTGLNFNFLKVLLSLGYIDSIIYLRCDTKAILKVVLKYEGVFIKFPYISVLRRISKPGQRVFSKHDEFYKKAPFLKFAPGSAIISTSKGLMTHKKAEMLKNGGEILCYIE